MNKVLNASILFIMCFCFTGCKEVTIDKELQNLLLKGVKSTAAGLKVYHEKFGDARIEKAYQSLNEIEKLLNIKTLSLKKLKIIIARLTETKQQLGLLYSDYNKTMTIVQYFIDENDQLRMLIRLCRHKIELVRKQERIRRLNRTR